MPGKFTGRVALVTGGASGIGRATALRLAQAGATVFAGDILVEPENVADLAAEGVTLLTCDVRRDADVRHLVDTAISGAAASTWW